MGDSGSYQIDAAELHRVFPPVVRNDAQPHTLQQNATDGATAENAGLQAKIDLLREMVDDLRTRLDRSEDERRTAQERLTALLTNQTQPATKVPAVRPWVWLALGVVAIAAIIFKGLVFPW